MAKTFNPNRIGGGTVSIVRAADGTYSLKEEGFDAITSLNMIDLGEVAKVEAPVTLPVQPDDGTEELKNQTKAAFMLPKKDDGRDDPLTFEKTLDRAKKLSTSLQDVETIPDRGMGQIGARTEIKSPTETVFGKSTVEDEQRERQKFLPETKVESPSVKLSVQEKERRKPKFLGNVLDTLKGPKFKTDQTKFTGASERAALGFPGDKSEVAQAGSTRFLPSGIDTRSDQGLQEVPANTLGITANVPDQDLEADAGNVIREDIQPAARKTFTQSVNTALKGVSTILKSMPGVRLITSLGKQNNESAGAIALNRSKFNIVTSPGAMQGRIVGNDGSYDPSNNLFHGMNRDSAFGNLVNAGQKRIDRIEKTLATKNLKASTRKTLEDRRDNFKNELQQHKQDLKEAPVTGTTKPGQGGGSEAKGSSKIVCTMMNESYGFGSFRNKIWLRHSKNLAPEYQRGYHRLFLPLVKKAKTNKILKKILEHIAVHRTIDIRQQERNKIHLIGRVYRTILEPICYWAGKK